MKKTIISNLIFSLLLFATLDCIIRGPIRQIHDQPDSMILLAKAIVEMQERIKTLEDKR